MPKGVFARAARPVVNLYVSAEAGAALDDQLLYGDRVEIVGREDGFIHAAPIDPVSGARGNTGFVLDEGDPLLSDAPARTHQISAISAPIFSESDIKSPVLDHLSLGSELAAQSETGNFIKCQLGYVHKAHISPPDSAEGDWVSIAELFRHRPYIWGGRSACGVDCSGLVQNALRAAKIACPRNSGEQAAILGESLDISAGLPVLIRGDLIFWPGHVGIMQNSSTLLHANAYHMKCASEPLAAAQSRIEARYGPITALRRLLQ